MNAHDQSDFHSPALELTDHQPITDLFADGIGRIEIVGENVRLVFWRWRRIDGKWERVALEWAMVLPACAMNIPLEQLGVPVHTAPKAFDLAEGALLM